jgi:hypothetical protein
VLPLRATIDLVNGDLAFASKHGVAQFAHGLGMLVNVDAESCYAWRETPLGVLAA